MKRLLVLSIALSATVAAAPASKIPNDQASIVHALNRIGFGARPGDVDKVRAMGLDRYIEQQLHPERLPDPGMAARLSGLTTLGMSSREIAEKFAIPAMQARREKKQDMAAAGDPPSPGGTSSQSSGGQDPPERSPEEREMQQRAAQ